MSEQYRDEERDFESAVKRVIEQSKNAFQELLHSIQNVLSKLEQTSKLLSATESESLQSSENIHSSSLAEELTSSLNQCTQEIEKLFERQKESLSTFNIVLFGRTGAGKSSLIETFTRGDGVSVSQGESDWTTEVRPLEWRSCLKLYDTPGISGWGRTMSRSELEECAHRAVETADIVLACFDSQSQQAAKFQKVAEWIQKYGKPVIAILNQRNSHGHPPMRVPSILARRSLSQVVVQHTGNIRDELEKLVCNDSLKDWLEMQKEISSRT